MKRQPGLQRLLEGNRRFARGLPSLADRSASRREALSDQQQPFALILSCSDSRVPPEILFDCGLGELFVVRTAGHTIDDAVMESIQFGVQVLQIPLLVVLGHEQCGAVSAAVAQWPAGADEDAAPGHIVREITPAIAQCTPAHHQPDDTWPSEEQLAAIVQAHVRRTVNHLRREHAEMLAGVQVVGAYYHLASGEVDLLAE